MQKCLQLVAETVEFDDEIKDLNNEIAYPALYLKRNEDARLRAGHVWVFSNEVDTQRSPLTDFQPGEPCVIVDARDHPVGIGYVNPHSLICARLVERGLAHALDGSLIVHRLNVALSLRQRLFEEPYYRLVFGESDGLPGLTVDRFGEVLVAQATTAGMDRLKPEIEQALRKVLAPSALVWKNDAAIRRLEGLEPCTELAFGELPQPVVACEGGLRFVIDPLHGQKTGWFYDQRGNRDRLCRYAKDARVLDLFSYVGAWGLRAAAAGARDVLCVDASATAVEAITANARDNGLDDRVKVEKADAFEMLKTLRERRERFDIVVVDPPAFIKRKRDVAAGRQAYRRINEMAMQVLQRDGLLVSCSCSHHLTRAALLLAIQQSARHLERQVQVLEDLGQGADHPRHPAVPETEYLKGVICRVLPA